MRENPILFYGAEPPRCPRHFLKTRQNSPCAPRTLQGLLRLLGLSSTPSNTRPPRVFNVKTKQVGNFGPNSYASWEVTLRPYGRHTWHPCLESASSKRVSLYVRDGNANRQYRGGSRSSLRPKVRTSNRCECTSRKSAKVIWYKLYRPKVSTSNRCKRTSRKSERVIGANVPAESQRK